MSTNHPTYDFNEFKVACGEADRVSVKYQAKEDADRYFNLKTERRLLDFINNDGLEMLIYHNSNPWKYNPDPETPIMIDAYKFRTGNLRGYIAFFYSGKTKKWIIKSFKLDRDPDGLISQTLRKTEICIPWESGGEDDGEKK